MNTDQITRDTDRQTGITTRQMNAAPTGAIFVWPNALLNYPQRLAKKLGRTDLRIISTSAFNINVVAVKRLTVEDIVIDHATRLTNDGQAALDYIHSFKNR